MLVQGVEGSPYAVGFFGYAYYEENKDKLNVLSIEGVTPTFATVEDGSYPLARPLFLYTTAKIMQEKPQVASFINYYLTNVDEEIGYGRLLPGEHRGAGRRQASLARRHGPIDRPGLSGATYRSGTLLPFYRAENEYAGRHGGGIARRPDG